ncbi:oligosaccharide flippase family protein [Citrobacter amalonaticus]|nr:oligosaccharide flippase family protein [Citrobacter amalonaticus]
MLQIRLSLFLFLPYLSHMLTISDLGKLELFNTYVALLTLAILFGLDGWCASKYNELEHGDFSRKIILGLKISVILCLISLVILFLLDKKWWIILSPIYALSMCIIQIRTLTLRLQFKTAVASFILFLNVLSSTLLTIGTFIFDGNNLNNRIIALFLPALVISTWSAFSIFKEFKTDTRISASEFVKFIHYTAPLVPNGLINFIRFGADKFYVAHFFGVSNLALFGVSYQFAMIANIFMLSLNQAVMPFTMRLLNEGRIKRFLKLVLILVSVFTIFILMLWGCTPYVLCAFFDEKYITSQYISNVYYLAYPLVFLSILLMNIAFVRGRTKLILLVTSVSSITHLLILFYFSEKNSDLFHIPYALLISSAVSLVLAIISFSRLIRNV